MEERSMNVIATSCPLRVNKSIDTDVLSAGFARLLSAGHLQRYAALNRKPDSAPGGHFRQKRRLRLGSKLVPSL